MEIKTTTPTTKAVNMLSALVLHPDSPNASALRERVAEAMNQAASATLKEGATAIVHAAGLQPTSRRMGSVIGITIAHAFNLKPSPEKLEVIGDCIGDLIGKSNPSPLKRKEVMAKATDFIDFWKATHSTSNNTPRSLPHLYESRTAQAAFLEYAFMPEDKRMATAIHLAAGVIFRATKQRPPKGLIVTISEELYFASQVVSRCSLDDMVNAASAATPIGPARFLVSHRLTRWIVQRLLARFFGASSELSSHAGQSPEHLSSFLAGVAIAGFFLAALHGEPGPTGSAPRNDSCDNSCNGSCAACAKE